MLSAKTEITGAEQMLEGIINHVPVVYAYNNYDTEFKSYSDGTAFQNDLSQQIYGDRTPDYSFEFYWIRELATAQSQQDILIDRLNKPIWTLKVKDISGINLFLELGDIIQYSALSYYSPTGDELINQYFLIIGFDLSLDDFLINWTLVDTRSYRIWSDICLADGTYYADGTYSAGDNKDLTIY